jgi:Luciferase-like monooxygenase
MKVRFAVGPGGGSLQRTDLTAFADAVETAGFDGVWLSDLPVAATMDPRLGLALIAGRTDRLRLGANIVPLGRNRALVVHRRGPGRATGPGSARGLARGPRSGRSGPGLRSHRTAPGRAAGGRRTPRRCRSARAHPGRQVRLALLDRPAASRRGSRSASSGRPSESSHGRTRPSGWATPSSTFRPNSCRRQSGARFEPEPLAVTWRQRAR